MTHTLADAEVAIQAAIVKVQSLGEMPTRPTVIDAAVKRLMMADASEKDARDLVAHAVAAMRQKGTLNAHHGPLNLWMVDEAHH